MTAPMDRGKTHFGDPCIHCGVAQADVPKGSCQGDFAKAIVIGWASLGVRWDGVETYRFRLSDNSIHDVCRHVSDHAPYWHFGRRDEFGNPPPYDQRLKERSDG